MEELEPRHHRLDDADRDGEAGVLLDLFVGIFVSSIIIHHINREFSSLDTRRLSLLKD